MREGVGELRFSLVFLVFGDFLGEGGGGGRLIEKVEVEVVGSVEEIVNEGG